MRVDRFLAVFLRVSAVAGAAGVSDVRFPFLEARAWELSSPFKSRLLARARARARTTAADRRKIRSANIDFTLLSLFLSHRFDETN